jgi:hypothetical protein
LLNILFGIVSINLVIGDNFHFPVLHDTHAGVGRAQIDAHGHVAFAHLEREQLSSQQIKNKTIC